MEGRGSTDINSDKMKCLESAFINEERGAVSFIKGTHDGTVSVENSRIVADKKNTERGRGITSKIARNTVSDYYCFIEELD